MNLSPRFLGFLEEYAHKTGKSPERIVEEAVSQAILRHSSPDEPSPHDAQILCPPALRRQLVASVPSVDPRSETDTPFGVLLERLPDRNWTYHVGRIDEYWFLIVSEAPVDLPEPLEIRSVEHSQAYSWIFGYTKSVKLWSGQDLFLIVF